MTTWHQRDRRKRQGLGNWKIIRYADDFVVLVSGGRHHAQALREQVTAVLAPLGLRLSEEKTRVVHIDEGFDFLGFHIRRMRKRGTEQYFVYTFPSRKAIQSVKDKVKAKTSRSTLHMSPEEMIASLDRTLRGWANYFRHGVSSTAFGHVDYLAWTRLARWLRRKHNGLSWRAYRSRFCLPGTWKIAYRGAVFRGASSVAITRYRYRGANIPTPWTPGPQPQS
jgi:RNA-directed DNA polymerase